MSLLWTTAVGESYDSQSPMYHATHADLQPGDILRPGREVGHANFPYQAHDEWRRDRVWMHPDPFTASQYRPDHHVYEVHPARDWQSVGEHEDPEYHDENDDDVHASSARVVRRLNPEEALGI